MQLRISIAYLAPGVPATQYSPWKKCVLSVTPLSRSTIVTFAMAPTANAS